MTEPITEPITAAQAAQLTQATEQQRAEANAEAIREVLPAVYAAVREAATAQVPTYVAEVPLAPFRLNPPQRLTLTRELQRQGFKAHTEGDTLVVGWSPAPTRRAALDGPLLPPGTQSLRE